MTDFSPFSLLGYATKVFIVYIVGIGFTNDYAIALFVAVYSLVGKSILISLLFFQVVEIDLFI